MNILLQDSKAGHKTVRVQEPHQRDSLRCLQVVKTFLEKTKLTPSATDVAPWCYKWIGMEISERGCAKSTDGAI